MALPLLIAALSMGALVYQLATRARAWNAAGSLTLRSMRGPREILTASRRFFEDAGWTANDPEAGSRTFYRRLRPAGPEVVALFLLGIVPGLLYLLLAKTTTVITVSSDGADSGSTTVISWTHGGECEAACRAFASLVRRQEPSRRRRVRRTGRRKVTAD